MDLVLYASIIRRFWFIALSGLILALALSFLSLVRISPKGVAYRHPSVWQSQTTLLLTQSGFPWGRAVLPSNLDPTRFSTLTTLYVEFANSDAVRAIMRAKGAAKTWKLAAAPVLDGTGATLPVIELSGQATSERDARAAATLGRTAFLEYVSEQQQSARIPGGDRINIVTLEKPTLPTVAQGQKKILPIVIFLAVAAATVALIFLLENYRSREHISESSATFPGSPTSPATSLTRMRASSSLTRMRGRSS